MGDVAQIAAPQVAKKIGDYFAETNTLNNKAAHGVAHAILAASVAAAGGNDALTAGVAAGGAEIAAPLVAQWLYGTDNPENLTAEQKSTLSNITALAGAAAGATTGNVTDIAATTNAVTNAVDNNYLSYHEAKELDKAIASLDSCLEGGGNDCAQFKAKIDDLNALDRERDEKFNACVVTPTLPGCSVVAAEMIIALQSYSDNGYTAGTGGKLGKEHRQLVDKVPQLNARLAYPDGYVGLAKATINLGADFTPIIGDIKGFAEAETIGDYIFAAVGLIPVGGDAAKKAHDAYTIAKQSGDVPGMKKAMQEANNVIEESRDGVDNIAGGVSDVKSEVPALDGGKGSVDPDGKPSTPNTNTTVGNNSNTPDWDTNQTRVDGEFGDLPYGTTVTNRPDFESLTKNSNVEFKEGWDASRVYDEVLSSPNGSRPDPSTYLSQSQIDAHISQFDDGAVRFTSRSGVNEYGTVGPDGGFVLPKSEFDRVLSEANGNLRVVEQRLGLDQGYLGDSDTMAIFIKPEDMKNIRIPSGNEGGANSQWIPGGYTNGGVPEAVMDFSHKPPVVELKLNSTGVGNE